MKIDVYFDDVKIYETDSFAAVLAYVQDYIYEFDLEESDIDKIKIEYRR